MAEIKNTDITEAQKDLLRSNLILINRYHLSLNLGRMKTDKQRQEFESVIEDKMKQIVK